jgi:hypothetical protein
MRIISISTDVFAALWGRRRPGEETENAILERLLGLPSGPAVLSPGTVRPAAPPGRPPGTGGRPPNRFGVVFPDDCEIFRTYKGKEYRAYAREDGWEMNKEIYPTLLALSRNVAHSNENPWMNWKYRDAGGKIRPIAALRNHPAADPEADDPPRKKAKPRGGKGR